MRKLPLVKRSLYEQAARDARWGHEHAAYLRELLEAVASNQKVMRVLDTGYPEKRLPFPYVGGTLGSAVRSVAEVKHPRWPPPVAERRRIIAEANAKLADLADDDPGPIRFTSESDFDYAVRVLESS